MAETAATSAFGAARDGVRAIGDRLDALGPGADALFEALAKRLGSLPAAAGYSPFGALGSSMAQALGGDTTTTGSANARSTKPRPKAASSAARSPLAPAATKPSSPFLAGSAHLGAALAGGAIGRPPQASLARDLIVEPAMQAMATLARLAQPAASAKKRSTDSPLALPAALAQHVAQWLADHLEQAATPSLAGVGAAVGGAANGLLSAQELILRGLAGLGAHARPPTPVGTLPDAAGASGERSQKSQKARPPVAKTAPADLTEPAPRAGSKLLPRESGSAGDAKPSTAERNAPADPALPEASDDPIDAMTRALVDQAWLRGVDLR